MIPIRHTYVSERFSTCFAAAELPVNVYVAHGILCNDPSAYIATAA